MKAHALDWAVSTGIDPDKLETRHGKLSHVLKEPHKRWNVHDGEWWRYIEGKEHLWARALNSSQCFAVNLFAPLAENTDLAKAVLGRFAPDLPQHPKDQVRAFFEYTPEGAHAWLGESERYPTQVDVAFEVWRDDHLCSVLLIEVKFTETDFSSCRGFAPPSEKSSFNPDRSRCFSAADLYEVPQKYCWMVEHHGRTYWDLLQRTDSSLNIDRLPKGEACPFRGGLYQVMRNAVLADEMRRRNDLDWAGFALCVHGSNEGVWVLDEPVAGENDIRLALPSMLTDEMILIDPGSLVAAVLDESSAHKDWAGYMQRRYLL